MILEDSVNDLSDCVLLQIFKSLSKRDLWRARSVCKRWYILLSDSELWRTCDLSDFNLDDNKHFSKFVDYIPIKHLEYLEISRKVIQANIIKSLLQTALHLQGLTLRDCILQTAEDVIETRSQVISPILFTPSKDMVFLDVRATRGNMEVFENLIIENGNRIKVLGVSNSFCSLHLIKNRTSSFLYYFQNLSILEFQDCSWVNDDSVRNIGTFCPNIQSVNVVKCRNISGTCVGQLLQNCKQLQTLILQQTRICGGEMMRVNWKNSKLTELDISRCYHLDDMASLQIIRALAPQLTYLRCAFTDHSLKEFIRQENPVQLQKLELRRRDPLGAELLCQFLCRCKQLIALDFVSIPIEFDTMGKILPNLPNLKWIYLPGNEIMRTTNVLEILIKHCKQLETVGINYYHSTCNKELSEVLHKFVTENKKLKNLHLEGTNMSDVNNQLLNIMKTREFDQHHKLKTQITVNKMKDFQMPKPDLSVDNSAKLIKHP